MTEENAQKGELEERLKEIVSVEVSIKVRLEDKLKELVSNENPSLLLKNVYDMLHLGVFREVRNFSFFKHIGVGEAKLGNIDFALKLANSPFPNGVPEIYEAVLSRVLAQDKDPEKAMDLVEKLEDNRQKAESYSKIGLFIPKSLTV